MKYVQLFYNPMSGNRDFPNYLDAFIETFQEAGYEARLHRTSVDIDYKTFFLESDLTECEAIFVAGGDGSINKVVNSILDNHIDIPLGVIPAGTANDFASHLKMPTTYSSCFKVLAKMNRKKVDVGKVNDKYFINVCCGGLFASISQNIALEFKNTLGKLAYYFKGVQQLPKFKKIRFRITTEKEVIEDYFFLFLVLNGSSAGGFNKLGVGAQIDDGLLDFIGIKACSINDMALLFGKILRGEHLQDKNIVFFKGEKIKIECLDESELVQDTDIDGERGPDFPLNIEVQRNALNVICNIEKDED